MWWSQYFKTCLTWLCTFCSPTWCGKWIEMNAILISGPHELTCRAEIVWWEDDFVESCLLKLIKATLFHFKLTYCMHDIKNSQLYHDMRHAKTLKWPINRTWEEADFYFPMISHNFMNMTNQAYVIQPNESVTVATRKTSYEKDLHKSCSLYDYFYEVCVVSK